MTREEAAAIVLQWDGRVRHARQAQLSVKEGVSLRLRAEGRPDGVIARWVQVPTSS